MDSQQLDQYKLQEALQQQDINAKNAMLAPQLQEQIQQNQAIIIQETDPKKIVEDIKLRLKGLERQLDGSLKRVSAPMMNKEGIDKISYLLTSMINQNIIFSNLESKQINSILMGFSDNLVDNLALNWKIYGIQYKTDLDSINDTVLTNINAALKRSERQNEKNWLSKVSMETINRGSSNNFQKEGGFWSKLKL